MRPVVAILSLLALLASPAAAGDGCLGCCAQAGVEDGRGRDFECPCCGPDKPKRHKDADSCKRVCLCDHEAPQQTPQTGAGGWSLPQVDEHFAPAALRTSGVVIVDGGVNRRTVEVIPPLRV